MKFIEEVLGLFDKDELPESSKNCAWCDYISEFQDA